MAEFISLGWEASEVQLALWYLRSERSNGIQGRPRRYWHTMPISNAVNTDVTQNTLEQTNAASVLWNFITSHFSMFSKDYSFTQC